VVVAREDPAASPEALAGVVPAAGPCRAGVPTGSAVADDRVETWPARRCEAAGARGAVRESGVAA
jgi:hypothetical protein